MKYKYFIAYGNLYRIPEYCIFPHGIINGKVINHIEDFEKLESIQWLDEYSCSFTKASSEKIDRIKMAVDCFGAIIHFTSFYEAFNQTYQYIPQIEKQFHIVCFYIKYCKELRKKLL